MNSKRRSEKGIYKYFFFGLLFLNVVIAIFLCYKYPRVFNVFQNVEYLEETKNTPIDTFHRVKYVTDGFAWIDNNGGKNQQIIRQDSGILPSSIYGGRQSQVRRILRESSEINAPEAVSSEVVNLQEAIEGAKGINERLVRANLTPKFNLNASPEAIRTAYIQELKEPLDQNLSQN